MGAISSYTPTPPATASVAALMSEPSVNSSGPRPSGGSSSGSATDGKTRHAKSRRPSDAQSGLSILDRRSSMASRTLGSGSNGRKSHSILWLTTRSAQLARRFRMHRANANSLGYRLTSSVISYIKLHHRICQLVSRTASSSPQPGNSSGTSSLTLTQSVRSASKSNPRKLLHPSTMSRPSHRMTRRLATSILRKTHGSTKF
ncbi:hypothetical protein BC828DRAFT_391337 [Blastocladiella britannica]|nr:hypothetical protein BC828DRAFT_391337 [Blastocladiella britannica]